MWGFSEIKPGADLYIPRLQSSTYIYVYKYPGDLPCGLGDVLFISAESDNTYLVGLQIRALD